MKQPFSRDLAIIVEALDRAAMAMGLTAQFIEEALDVTNAELEFTATRLERKLRRGTDTDQEADHLEDLVRGYRSAQHYIELLLRYQRGRLTKQRSPSGSALPAGSDIDAAGRGRAHITDEESPT